MNRLLPFRGTGGITVIALVLAVVSCSGDKSGEVVTPEKREKAAVEPVTVQSGDTVAGERIYREHCKMCHGAGGKGDIGPSLIDDVWKYGNADNDIYYSIAKGRPGGMPNWEYNLGEDNIRHVMAYLRSLKQK